MAIWVYRDYFDSINKNRKKTQLEFHILCREKIEEHYLASRKTQHTRKCNDEYRFHFILCSAVSNFCKNCFFTLLTFKVIINPDNHQITVVMNKRIIKNQINSQGNVKLQL